MPSPEDITADTMEAIHRVHPDTSVEILEVKSDDPTDYREVITSLRNHVRQIQDRLPGAHFSIAVASGAPHMHACWVLLAATGEIPARIVNVRPPRFVTAERPLVREVDLSSEEFPVVRSQIGSAPEAEAGESEIQSTIIQQGIVGDHSLMLRALETATLLAPSHAPLLVSGGTGKGLLARFVHRVSERHKGPFVPVNCAAVPELLVESLLFGHTKGAFTGVLSDQVGKFYASDGGTLFLDEWGELPSSAQAKLLRVLQNGFVEPIGARQPHKVDVRVIGATNRDLRKLVRKGTYREDLFYRHNVGEVVLPPLSPCACKRPFVGPVPRPNGYPTSQVSRTGGPCLQEFQWPSLMRISATDCAVWSKDSIVRLG